MSLSKEQIVELKELIAIGHYKPPFLNRYKYFYQLIHGRKYTGCNCQGSTLYTILSHYVSANKL